MDVEIAEQRIMVFRDRFSASEAEERAWTKRVEAFGTLAKMTGFLTRPKDDEFELVYRERRLQPFWRIASLATCAYERSRDYRFGLAAEVRRVVIEGQERVIEARHFTVRGVESCREESRRQILVDALSGVEEPKLAGYLDFTATEADAAHLATIVEAGDVVAPPQIKAAGLVRDAVSKAIGVIDADKVLEETVRLEMVDLYYRPVFAFRYRRADKEAVVECDGLTGEVKTAGSTFEQHLGKVLEPKFLLDIGAEAANIFIPGATVAKLALVKGMELHEKRKAAKAP